ncbi:hypothetical protein B932_1364 [Gluconobacter oxydans H24]|nr:hypothetical protein B932_1364 [Gluconobacter oxydans H24]
MASPYGVRLLKSDAKIIYNAWRTMAENRHFNDILPRCNPCL